MAYAHGRNINDAQGPLSQTGGAFDFAIEGEGYFMIETPQGNQLSRAGSFTPSAEGELVTPDGHRLLDAGGTPIFVPTDQGPVSMAQDGTLSAGGRPIAQVGVYMPDDPNGLVHTGGTRFVAEAGTVPAEGAVLLQGFVEDSNVEPVSEIARMIEVQRAYEMGQTFLDREDERIRSVISTLGR
jgi:flagellar basal-body rod protein FlgF